MGGENDGEGKGEHGGDHAAKGGGKGPPEKRPGDWECPNCHANVFASKDECFKCHTKKDGSKGDGKGKGDGIGPAPDRYSETLWEQPREEIQLPLIGELAQQGGTAWTYVVNDPSRRSFAAYLSNPFEEGKTRSFYEHVELGTTWSQPEGPLGPIPRKTAWMVAPGGCSCTYRYGRIEVEPQIFPPWMIDIMKEVMPRCGLFNIEEWPNSCNLNLYDDGAMSVGWHSDDESLFQGKFVDIRIVSLSLGTRRKFEIRTNWPGEGERPVRTMSLGDGDLCTMEGMFQKHFQHRVPKESGIDGPRINLTWRWVRKHAPKCPAGRPRR